MSAEDLQHSKFSRKIGLTGGIASGKSSVSQMLKQAGFPVLDFDQVAREVRQEPEIENQIQSEFGTTQKEELRRIIFSSESNRKKIMDLVSPRLLEKGQELHEHLLSISQLPVIWDAALLVEYDLHQMMDLTLVVSCPEDVRMKRLIDRDKTPSALAIKIIQSQASEKTMIERLKNHPHHWIKNDSDLNNLKNQVQIALEKIRSIYE